MSMDPALHNHIHVADGLVLESCAVATLMYGFGDEKIVAADTVNVMEEIVIEYITDLVRIYAHFSHFLGETNLWK